MSISRDQIQACINAVADACDAVASAVGTDLRRDDEGFIVDDSDLGIAVRELERVSTVLSRLSYCIGEET